MYGLHVQTTRATTNGGGILGASVTRGGQSPDSGVRNQTPVSPLEEPFMLLSAEYFFYSWRYIYLIYYIKYMNKICVEIHRF